MKRTAWEFPYTADRLLSAATGKCAHHADRLKWWENKKTSVVEMVKAEGIEIDESLADLTSNSYQRGATVQIRNDLVRDLQECVGKIREHRTKVDDYGAWMQVLASQGQSTFNLHQEDWLFFFGQ